MHPGRRLRPHHRDEQPRATSPPEDEPRTYRQQSYPKRLLVVSAGSIMHLLQAFVFLFVVFTLVGVPGDSTLAERRR